MPEVLDALKAMSRGEDTEVSPIMQLTDEEFDEFCRRPGKSREQIDREVEEHKRRNAGGQVP